MDIAAAIVLRDNLAPLAVNALGSELISSAEWGRLHTEILQRAATRTHSAIFPVHRGEKSSSWVVWVTPLAELPTGRNGMCLCFVFDPDWQVSAACRLVQATFRLTPAELRLAEQLLLGRRPSEAAAELGVTIHTVRTYLKRLYQKVGVHTQAKLVRKLMQVASTPGPPAP